MTTLIRDRISIFIIFTAIAGIIYSCNTREKIKDEISEGKVLYKITYPPEIKSHSMSFLFPQEMTLYFKNDKQRISFKGNMSLYSLDFINFNQKDSFITLLKVIEKKLYVPSTKSGDIFLFQNFSKENIIFNEDETRDIAGYICEKAEIKPSNKQISDIIVWFTKEVMVKNPYRNTPFEEIPGLMLEFEVDYNNIIFHFKAQKVEYTSISESLFIVPDDYTKSSINEIEGLIKSVIN